MLELLKTVIEHILSWPVAAFLLACIFYKPLKGLIERINSIKGPGFDLSAPPASAQTRAIESAPPEVVKGEIGSASSSITAFPAATPAGANALLEEKRKAVRKFGDEIPMVKEIVVSIKQDLSALSMPLGSEDTGEILVRHLAATQLAVRCERTHRLIFGSQLVALHLLNNSGAQPEKTLRPIFENARTQEPQFYGSYTFENWIGFLIKEGTLIINDQNLYAITVYGRSYLQYIGVFATAPRQH